MAYVQQQIVFSIFKANRLPWWLSGKESACDTEDTGETDSISGLGRFPGGGHGNPLQYSCLENLMDRGALRVTVNGVSKSRTRLKRLSMHAGCPQKGPQRPLGEGNGNPLQYSARRIPWTEEPGGLWSLGLQRVIRTEVTEHRGLWGLTSSPTPL